MADQASAIASSIPGLDPGKIGKAVAAGDVGGLVTADLKAAEGEKKAKTELDTARLAEIKATDASRHKIEEGMPKVPELQPYQPPAPTDPWQLWGSPMMILAGLSGFMGRRSAAKSLDAAAGMMKATNEKDATVREEAFKKWKVENENAGKVFEWQNQTYEHALKAAGQDAASQEAAYKTMAHMLEDNPVREALEKEGIPGAEKLLAKRTEDYRMSLQYGDKIEQRHLLDEGNKLVEEERAVKQATFQALASKDPAKIEAAHRAEAAVAERAAAHKAKIDEYMRVMEAAKGKPAPGSADADVGPVADMIAHYQIPPPTLSRGNTKNAAIMEEVKRINPEYNAALYTARSKAISDWVGAGKHADLTRGFNVALSHLDTLEELSRALGNGNLTVANDIANEWGRQNGHPEISGYEALPGIISTEIVKNISGSGATGSAEERLEGAKTFASNKSPKALSAAVDGVRELLVGQVLGLEREYRTGTGFKDFREPDRYLGTEALAQIKRHEEASAARKGAGGDKSAGKAPSGVEQATWEHMTAEERALWAN
jgi:hypothetical protein